MIRAMGSYVVRPVADDERREALTVVLRSLHGRALTDEQWDRRSASFPADRTFGAFDGGTLAGSASSFAAELRVPGGKQVPVAAVDGVGVRADHTRRGVFTQLMRAQLADCVERGDVLAALHASETTIYGRAGYGVATHGANLRIDRARARVRPQAPSGGRVRLLTQEEVTERVPALYQRIAPYRTGMITRPPVWWPQRLPDAAKPDGDIQIAVHSGPDGEDGYLAYRTEENRQAVHQDIGAVLRVRELCAADPDARAGLWRFLLGVDLVSEIDAPMRPADEPVGAMLVDPRACRTVGIEDELWVRIVDVPAALAARSYRAAEPVVIEVRDPQLERNAGRYRIGPDGAERTEEPAHVRMDVDVLAMLYLGEWRPSTLAQFGWIEVVDGTRVPALDELLATASRPWCGTGF